jgi:hypothetical protein
MSGIRSIEAWRSPSREHALKINRAKDGICDDEPRDIQ